MRDYTAEHGIAEETAALAQGSRRRPRSSGRAAARFIGGRPSARRIFPQIRALFVFYRLTIRPLCTNTPRVADGVHRSIGALAGQAGDRRMATGSWGRPAAQRGGGRDGSRPPLPWATIFFP